MPPGEMASNPEAFQRLPSRDRGSGGVQMRCPRLAKLGFIARAFRLNPAGPRQRVVMSRH